MKRQPIAWEKIFANEVIDMELVSKIHKQLMQLIMEKTTKSKMVRRLKQTFLQRRHIDDQQAHEKMLNVAIYQGNANRTYSEVSPHTSQNGHHQKVYNNTCQRGCGEKGTLLHALWECKVVQPPWRTVWRFLRKLKIELPYDLSIQLQGIQP